MTTDIASTSTSTAVVVRTPGDADALELVQIPSPVAGPGEVVVDVTHAGVNPVDVSTRAGFFHSVGLIPADAPQTGLGWEVVGTVTESGPTSDWAPGTRVAALLPGMDRPTGGYATQVVVPATHLAAVPDELPSDAAATIPLNALTAAGLLDLAGHDGAGRTMLVTGAAGAVGYFLVHLARAAGYAVTGLARAGDGPLLAEAGATPATSIEGTFDVVVDAASLVDPALAAVAGGGTYLGVLPALTPDPRPGITVTAVSVEPDGARLATLLHQAADGTLPTRVAGVLPLSEAAEAHRILEQGGVRGRYLLEA